jgi:phosphoribosyl-ATP pyrophosphohydrolase/phosphoribosyl-AMP cyclohydrolase
MNDNTPEFTKDNGLLPAVIQHCKTGVVLMVGYMNEEAYSTTLETGRVTFYSRSKERLWTKGESSGNWLEVRAVSLDCDRDAILIQALPAGPTCHTGRESCFDQNEQGGDSLVCGPFLSELTRTISQRHLHGGPQSYTHQLLCSGLDRIVQKVGEEGVEVVIAGKNEDTEKLVDESADLIFHLMVLLEARGVTLGDVEQRLRERSL